MSDPRLKEMTRTRWLFEVWQIRLKEDTLVKRITSVGEQAFKAFRDTLIGVLGLNIEPIGRVNPLAPDGDPVYEWPKEGEFTPLIYAIARPDYMKQAMEKIQGLMPGGVDVSKFDEEEGFTEDDLVFFDELPVDAKKAFWNSTEMEAQLRQLVIQKDPKDVDPHAKVQPRPKGIDKEFRERQKAEEQFGSKGKKSSFTILDDDDMMPPEFRR